MRYVFILMAAIVSLAMTAQNIVRFYPVEPAMAELEAANKESDVVVVFFRGQAHPSITKKIGETQSHNKANADFRSDPRACRAAFLAAVRDLRQRASREGGNALVNVRSDVPSTKSKPGYRCVATDKHTEVRLEGDVVQIDDAKLAEFRTRKKTAP